MVRIEPLLSSWPCSTAISRLWNKVGISFPWVWKFWNDFADQLWQRPERDWRTYDELPAKLHTGLTRECMYCLSVQNNPFVTSFYLSSQELFLWDHAVYGQPTGYRPVPCHLSAKVQNLLIADFLNYLALRHNVYLSTMSELLKKKPSITPSATAES